MNITRRSEIGPLIGLLITKHTSNRLIHHRFSGLRPRSNEPSRYDERPTHWNLLNFMGRHGIKEIDTLDMLLSSWVKDTKVRYLMDNNQRQQ